MNLNQFLEKYGPFNGNVKLTNGPFSLDMDISRKSIGLKKAYGLWDITFYISINKFKGFYGDIPKIFTAFIGREECLISDIEQNIEISLVKDKSKSFNMPKSLFLEFFEHSLIKEVIS